jgi:superfamily I DNA/RNA helicase
MPHVNEDAHAEARLRYVAMTRAMDELLMTGHRQSEFVARLMRAAEGGKAA